MSYLDMITFDGPQGTVAIDPKAATLVWKRDEGCDVQLKSNDMIRLNLDAKDVARALWGNITGGENGYYNDDHVLAIIPNGTGSQIILEGTAVFNEDTPPNKLIMTLRNLSATRARL